VEAAESEGEGSTWGGREGGGIDTEDYLLKLRETEREREEDKTGCAKTVLELHHTGMTWTKFL
jgi:hypothetical protein